MLYLGVDNGNNEIKTMGAYGTQKVLSCLGEATELNLGNALRKDDMIYEYEGKRGFAGTLAEEQSEFKRNMMGDTKAHEDAMIRVLIALHRYSDHNEFAIVVGQPISKHKDEEKRIIKEMLKKNHLFTLNGVRKSINIRRVEVAAEGGASFWCQPEIGTVRIIDIGSGTINCATLKDKRYIEKECYTIQYGMNTNKSNNIEALAQSIITETSKKWGKHDNVRIVGGAAEVIEPYIQRYYTNANTFYPRIKEADLYKRVHPVFANAIGYYNIARSVLK